MTRLAISVEGLTERIFVNTVLAPHLYATGFTEVVPLLFMKSRGGDVNLDRIANELAKGPKSVIYSFDMVTTLYDYYGFKGRSGKTPDQLETEILNRIPDDHHHCFIPYVQQYEFEALLFSCPETLTSRLGCPDKTEAISKIVKKCGEPECINDGYETCPSRRLKKLFSDFNKLADGPPICEAIGLTTLREKCPRFSAWLDEIEQKRRALHT